MDWNKIINLKNEFSDEFFSTLINFFYESGITPNIMSLFKIVMLTLASIEYYSNNILTAFFFIIFNIVFDIIDGGLARKYEKFSKNIDTLSDFFGIIILFTGFLKNTNFFLIILLITSIVIFGFSYLLNTSKSDFFFLKPPSRLLVLLMYAGLIPISYTIYILTVFYIFESAYLVLLHESTNYSTVNIKNI